MDLIQDLGARLGLIRDGSKSPAVQCAALEAQLWFQVQASLIFCSAHSKLFLQQRPHALMNPNHEASLPAQSHEMMLPIIFRQKIVFKSLASIP